MPRDKKKITKPSRAKTARKAGTKRTKAEAAPVAKLIDDPGAPLGYHILASARVYNNALYAALAEKPSTSKLTVPRLQAMQLIAVNDGITGADLARALNVTPQTVTTLLNSLAAFGWIERTSVPGKGRAIHTHLTAAGRTQMNRGVAAAAKVNEELAASYSHDGVEAHVLTNLLSLGRQTFAPVSQAA